jgi:hypothetical protein
MLCDWRVRFLPGHPMPWKDELIHAALALLLRPSATRRLPLESALMCLLTDRLMARAVAFTAWRAEQLARLSLDEEVVR